MQLKKEDKPDQGPKQLTPVIKITEVDEYKEQRQSVENMITTAIKEKVDVGVMERFLLMRKELKAEYAKEQFDKAMAGFQGECPVIKKTKKVMNKDGKSVRYVYAPIDSIVEQVKDMLAKYGLSYTIKVRNNGKEMTVVCRVTHKAGHSEDSEFEVPLSSEEYMSDVQKFGARSTFAKRYAFCNAFGIMTGDDDDDAQSTIGEKRSPQAPPKVPLKTPPAKIPPKPDTKAKIMYKLNILSHKKLETAEQCREATLQLTQLELTEKNYEEINDRLKIKIKEKEEADKLRNSDAIKYPPVSVNKLKLLRDLARQKMSLISDKVVLEWIEFEYKVKLAKLENLNTKQANQVVDYLLALKGTVEERDFLKDIEEEEAMQKAKFTGDHAA